MIRSLPFLMKILILTYNYPPQKSAGANRLAGLARAFQAAGWQVAVVAARFVEDGALAAADDDLTEWTEWVDCRTVRRGSFPVRFLDEWRIAGQVFARAECGAADFVVVTTPVLSFMLRGAFVVPREKLVIDLRDLTWEYRISPSLIVRGFQQILAVWSRRALSRARLVACTTAAEKRYIERRVPGVETIHVANGIEQAVMSELAAAGEPRASHAQRQVVLYAGSLGKAQGVAILADAAVAMPDWDFVVLGAGVEARALEHRQQAECLSNLGLLGMRPRAEVLERYGQASVLFVRLRPGFGSAVPSKIYEYLATGKPIVYMGSADDAAWEVLDSFVGMARVDDEDLAGLVTALSQARPCPAEAVEGNALRLAAYTREAQANRLITRLEELSRRSASGVAATAS